MKAIEQWSPNIFVDLSHGLEPRFDPSKPARPLFFFLFVCLFCFFVVVVFLFFANNTRQYFHISLQHFLDLIGVLRT